MEISKVPVAKICVECESRAARVLICKDSRRYCPPNAVHVVIRRDRWRCERSVSGEEEGAMSAGKTGVLAPRRNRARRMGTGRLGVGRTMGVVVVALITGLASVALPVDGALAAPRQSRVYARSARVRATGPNSRAQRARIARTQRASVTSRRSHRADTAARLRRDRDARIDRSKHLAKAHAAMLILQAASNSRHARKATLVHAAAAMTADVSFFPTANLRPGELVQITASGIALNNYFFIVECATDIGNGVQDCDLSASQSTYSFDGTINTSRNANRHIQLSDATVYDCGTGPSRCNFSWVDLGNPSQTGVVPLTFDPNAGIPLTVNVTPSTNLVHLQTVTVSGIGAGGVGSYVNLAQCVTGAPVGACRNSSYGYSDIDSSGNYVTDMWLRRIITGPSGPVDCAVANACEIVASEGRSLDLIARAALSFDPAGPVPDPISIVATPATGLTNLQTITVSGGGFDPFDGVEIYECTVDVQTTAVYCYDSLYVFSPVDASGHFSTSMQVRRIAPSANGPVDCATQTCRLYVSSYSGFAINIPIAFDPSVPPPPLPAIAVTPSTNLVDAQFVSITGVNFDPSSDVYLAECVVGVGCVRDLGYVTTASDGTFTLSTRVARLLVNYDNTSYDCADPAVACGVTAYDQTFQGGVSTNITFAPGPPPPPPLVSFVTQRALHDGRSYAVTGSHWFPGDVVYTTECVKVASGALLGCAYGKPQSSGIGGDGSLSLTITAHRLIPQPACRAVCPPPGSPPPAPYDCLTPGLQCYVTVNPSQGGASVEASMRFDRGAPLAPPPSFAVTPSTRLHDNQQVEISGRGFDSNESVYVYFCDLAQPQQQSCARLALAPATTEGTFAVTAFVRRAIQTFSSRAVCDTNGVQCGLQIYPTLSTGPVPLVVPVHFDPGAPLVLPTVTVAPSQGLNDGQVVQVSGSQFTPGATLVIIECQATATGASGCDIGNLINVTADASGQFATPFAVVGAFAVPGGSTVDCAAAPGNCYIAVANISALAEANSVLISFGG